MDMATVSLRWRISGTPLDGHRREDLGLHLKKISFKSVVVFAEAEIKSELPLPSTQLDLIR
jgi:hypothetical protein